MITLIDEVKFPESYESVDPKAVKVNGEWYYLIYKAGVLTTGGKVPESEVGTYIYRVIGNKIVNKVYVVKGVCTFAIGGTADNRWLQVHGFDGNDLLKRFNVCKIETMP